MRQPVLAGDGRLDAAADPLEQPHAEPAFELAYLYADRRLRQIKPLRRRGKLLSDRRNGDEVIEVEAAHR
jgi:hypothetical protein